MSNPQKPHIKFIIHNFWYDGQTISKITSTHSGNSIKFFTGGPSNAKLIVRELLDCDFSELYVIDVDLKRSKFRWIAEETNNHEMDINPEMLRKLTRRRKGSHRKTTKTGETNE